jgi:hypothetical protein
MFTNVNRQLVEGVEELLTSLGFKWFSRHDGHAWRVFFVPGVSHPVAGLTRKSSAQRHPKPHSTSLRRYITAVVPVPSVPVRCVGIQDEPNLFLVGRRAVPTHNTDNVFRPLQSMVKNGPLSERMRVGEEFIRLPNDGRIDIITSSALARLGNPITFALQDETGLYTVQNKLVRVAETQRRGAAGMGGRTMETTNAPDPTEQSVAMRTLESKAGDIFRFHRPPPAHLDYADIGQRRECHEHVYRGSDHVDLDAIDAEAAEIWEKDPAQAERFFGNRLVAGSGAAFDGDRWNELANDARIRRGEAAIEVARDELVVAGVDGARFRDALALVATGVVEAHQWPIDIQERPEHADDDYEHDFERADRAMLDLFDANDVWRVYVDPQYIESLFERWQGRWGDKVVLPWLTYRKRPMAVALQAYRSAQTSGELSHSGDPVMAAHIANATKRATNSVDDEGHPLWLIEKPSPRRKIDAAMAGCLSWEARGDAIAAGAEKKKKHRVYGL